MAEQPNNPNIHYYPGPMKEAAEGIGPLYSAGYAAGHKDGLLAALRAALALPRAKCGLHPEVTHKAISAVRISQLLARVEREGKLPEEE